MTYKYFYLFIAGGVLSLLLLGYDLFTAGGNVGVLTVLRGAIPAVLFFYLAYKVWHEKNDDELM
jgi:hypothetical protein